MGKLLLMYCFGMHLVACVFWVVALSEEGNAADDGFDVAWHPPASIIEADASLQYLYSLQVGSGGVGYSLQIR